MMNETTIETSTEMYVGLKGKESISVLYVDDESLFLKVAKHCLEIEGPFQVETAVSAEEAMGKLNEKAFDVVVSDFQMPGKNGLQFLKELREKGNRVPFIIMNGKGMEEVAIKALNLGAAQYVNKVGFPKTVYGELAHSIQLAVEARRAVGPPPASERKPGDLLRNARDALSFLRRARPMNWSSALMYASGFSYVAAAVMTLGGYPALDPSFLPESIQIIFYLVMPLLLAASMFFRPLRFMLSGLYGVAAMFSFSGVQQWVNYYGDPSILGPAMAAWDLSLAVALLKDS